MLTPEQDFARNTAVFLRVKGKNPLPTREDAKRPMLDSYAQYWDIQAPASLFTPEGWPPTRNLQLVLGRAWRLLALDLDGPEAIEQLATMGPPLPRTWVQHSGGGGQHCIFSLPPDYPDAMPKCFLWKGDVQ